MSVLQVSPRPRRVISHSVSLGCTLRVLPRSVRLPQVPLVVCPGNTVRIRCPSGSVVRVITTTKRISIFSTTHGRVQPWVISSKVRTVTVPRSPKTMRSRMCVSRLMATSVVLLRKRTRLPRVCGVRKRPILTGPR